MLDNSMFGSRVTERTSFFFHVGLPCQIPQVLFGPILRLDPRERFTQENNPTAGCFANPGIVHGLNILNPRSAEMVSSATMLGTNAGRRKAVQRCPSPVRATPLFSNRNLRFGEQRCRNELRTIAALHVNVAVLKAPRAGTDNSDSNRRNRSVSTEMTRIRSWF